MKQGVIIYSNDPETVWNAFRYGNFALAMGDEVKVFLISKGVECESIDKDVFKVSEQMQTFLSTGGKMFACGTCLEIRKMKPSGSYTVSTLKGLYDIVKDSDRVVTF